MQDNLARALGPLPGCPTLHGLYLALAHLSENDLPRSHKHGYLADTRRGDWTEEVVFKNGPAFEMFATARHGAAVGYQPAGSTGQRVKPVISLAEIERRNFRSTFAAVFRGIDDYFQDYLRIAPTLGITAAEWKPYLLDQLRRYILYPTATEARSFLRYCHVESFGVHRVSTYEFKGSWRQIVLGGSPLGLPHRLHAALRQQFWAEAILKRSRVPLANFAYDLLETRQANTR
jgi:hypothetical protein